MIEQIDEKINVITVFNAEKGKTIPYAIKWRNRTHKITTLALHHTTIIGNTLHHIFSVSSDTIFFRLNLDTQHLTWTLESVQIIE